MSMSDNVTVHLTSLGTRTGRPYGYRSGHPIWVPSGHPPGHPPATPPKPAPRPSPRGGENFRKFPGRAPGRPGGRPAAGPGGRPGAVPGTAQNGHFWVHLDYILFKRAYFWGIWHTPPFGHPPGTARTGKKCTFFWVFNNSPSRDKNGATFFSGFFRIARFPAQDTPPGTPIWDYAWSQCRCLPLNHGTYGWVSSPCQCLYDTMRSML